VKTTSFSVNNTVDAHGAHKPFDAHSPSLAKIGKLASTPSQALKNYE
jgi:hypothetical protein